MDGLNGPPGATDYAKEVERVEVPDGTPDPDRAREAFRPYLLEQARTEARKAGEGLPTGFDTLDRWGLRWKPGKLYVVAGRPGEGKTTLLLELLMRHVEAREAGTAPHATAPAVFVTYEENRHDLYLRLLLREVARERVAAGKNPGTPPRSEVEKWLREGSVSAGGIAAEWHGELQRGADRLNAHGEAGRLALVDGDREGEDVRTLLHTLEAAAAAVGAPPSLVAVDYFQKIRPPTDEYLRTSRQAQLQEVANLLRRYAKGRTAGEDGDTPTGYAVPVLVGAQVNRESVAGKEIVQPELHHIREADDLANDATGVLTLHRFDRGDGVPLKVKLVKNRDGQRDGTFEATFYGSCSYVVEPAMTTRNNWG